MKHFLDVCKKNAATALLIVLLAAGFLHIYGEARQYRMQQDIAEKILRFHVRANSDSKSDQALKLTVRDAVGGYMQKELAGTDSLKECIALVRAELPQIIDTAQRTVYAHGYDYPVTASVDETEFPDKTYGAYTFPAGSYLALNIVIGAGDGHNWWCVMYPNMCFHGSVYKVIDEEAEQSLKKTLSKDAYDAVRHGGKYEVRFKYLKFFNRFF